VNVTRTFDYSISSRCGPFKVVDSFPGGVFTQRTIEDLRLKPSSVQPFQAKLKVVWLNIPLGLLFKLNQNLIS